MIARPNVDALLAGPLGAWLDEQMLEREKARELSIKRWWTAAIIAGPVLLFLWIAIPGGHQLKAFMTMGVSAAAYAWGNAPRIRAIKAVKVGINEAIAKALDVSYSLDVEPGHSFGLACHYRLLPNHDRSNFEDLWHGTLGKRSFALHETHLQERQGSGKNRRYVTVFRGSIMQIDFSRSFHGTTLVERVQQHKSLFGFGGRRDSISFDGHRLDYVDLVHPDFEDNFCVYSDDQVEARYLIHPEYVERLMAVQKAFAGKDVRTLFTKGQLVIVIETGNLFESGSLNARDDRPRIVRTIEQFAALADLAHTLNEPERGFTAA